MNKADAMRIAMGLGIYPYPDYARYIGSGDPDDAANFRRVSGGAR